MDGETYVPALIRDARGITSTEALFLFVVDSRGPKGMFTTAERAAEDMKMSLRTFRTTRKGLLAKGLITVHQRPPKTSVYKVATAALAALTSAGTTSAEIARVPVQELHGSPVQKLQGSPVQKLHAEGEREGEQTKSHTNTYSPTPRFSRGMPPEEDGARTTKTSPTPRAGRYLYNRMAEPCAICRDWVQPEGGTLLRAEDGSLHAAHHVDECTRPLTDDERMSHLDGLVPITTPEVDAIDVAMAFADIEEHA